MHFYCKILSLAKVINLKVLFLTKKFLSLFCSIFRLQWPSYFTSGPLRFVFDELFVYSAGLSLSLFIYLCIYLLFSCNIHVHTTQMHTHTQIIITELQCKSLKRFLTSISLAMTLQTAPVHSGFKRQPARYSFKLFQY